MGDGGRREGVEKGRLKKGEEEQKEKEGIKMGIGESEKEGEQKA